MEFSTWKTALINEIETAAEWRAEKALGDDDPRIVSSQKALFDLADAVKNLPADHGPLKALFAEESELANLMRSTQGEPERRYHDAKEDLLRTYGIEHETFETPEQFLNALRNRVDETISEYRLRA
jgi:hypothetical protein